MFHLLGKKLFVTKAQIQYFLKKAILKAINTIYIEIHEIDYQLNFE